MSVRTYVENARLPPLYDPRVRVSRPRTRRLTLRDLPRATAVLRVLVARDIKVRYQQSIIGPLWLAFQPLALLAVFLVAFRGRSGAGAAGVPYLVFTLCGLSAWSFFQAATTIGAPSMISNMTLIKATPCPRIAPLLAGVASSLPSYGLVAIAAIVAAAADGRLSLRVLLLPVVLLWLMFLITGVVATLASFAVRYRDVITALPFLMQLGAFVAPVGYALNSVSPTLRIVLDVNPITGIAEASRWVILSGYRVDRTPLIVSAAITLAILLFGWRTFTKHETTMADII